MGSNIYVDKDKGEKISNLANQQDQGYSIIPLYQMMQKLIRHEAFLA